MGSRLWAFLNTDIQDIFSADTVTGGVEGAKAILEFSKKFKENQDKLPELARMLSPVSSLLDVLNSPLVEVVGTGLPFITIATNLLKFYQEQTQKDPTLAQCIALVSQAAYLESLKGFLEKDNNLLNRIGNSEASDDIQKKIKRLEKFEVSDEEAKKAVTCFHESELAKVFGKVLYLQLQQAGSSKNKAHILTLRVIWNTHRYMILAWAQSEEASKHLAQPTFADWRQEQEKYQSIENYLTEQIATKPQENVFAETFTFQDIYIPLQAKPIDKNGEVEEEENLFDIWEDSLVLEDWAKATLFDPQKQDQVLFIQAGLGRGKSVFCRMFADWVRRELYPIWIPILIRLRDIPKLQNSFRETLKDAVKADFASSDNGWLTDRNTRYLLFLDGFDELIIADRNSSGLDQFLRQVGQFQKDSATGKDMGHRVIVTGRTLALQGIERNMPDNLARVRIEVMDKPLQQQWLNLWEKLVGTAKKDAFASFLQDQSCPNQVKELAREPLLLYLLAAMHRDQKLDLEAFQQTNETQAKIVIYQESLDWVLTQQRPQSLQGQITGLGSEDLRCILIEAGLCVVQAGGEYAKVKMIEERLNNDIVAAIEEARSQAGDQVLKNALAAFYLKPAGADKDGGVEFFHKSFSEFLCAKRLKESFVEWTEAGRRGRGYNLRDEQFCEEVYDLLGYGGLTPEIVEYLMGLLIESEEFPFAKLFERLEDVYLRWSDGEFIDSPTETRPQRKCQKLQDYNIELGQRQVDVYTGLNVMILLFELHRYGQRQQKLSSESPLNPPSLGDFDSGGNFQAGSPQNWGARGALIFHPCGQLDNTGKPEDAFRLHRIIGYSRCVGKSCFLETVGQFLIGADLTGADLMDASLIGADLRGVDLIGADLRGVDLSGANLSGANLIGANLSGANLSGANLIGAHFKNANLSGADLSEGANLSDGNFRDANFSGANLTRVFLVGAIFIEANLSNADLSKAILMSADLRRANLMGASIQGTNLMSASIQGANLSEANLSEANLNDVNLHNIQWNIYTNGDNVLGLETNNNVPAALKR